LYLILSNLHVEKLVVRVSLLVAVLSLKGTKKSKSPAAVIHAGWAVHVSPLPALPIGKRQTLSIQGEAELLEPIWPYAMEPLDLSLADPA
jgi:hypothetical protein